MPPTPFPPFPPLPPGPLPEGLSAGGGDQGAEGLLQKPLLDRADVTPEEVRNPGLSFERWAELGACPIGEGPGVLVVAVPSDWGREPRMGVQLALRSLGLEAELLQARGSDITAALEQMALLASLRQAESSQDKPAEAEANDLVEPRSLTKDLELPSASGQLQEVRELEDLEVSEAETSSTANASPIVSLVDRILIEALSVGASDIHIEPHDQTLEIRFRIDGVLKKLFEDLPRSLVPAVTSRLKIMAELDIAERRLPQDGRIRRMFRGRKMDFRVSTLPTRNGEKVVLRLLDSGATQLGLDALITNAEARASLRELGSRPYGMILVTGPTGSGKSTTLYALLSERNNPDINISTVEDPIEYTMHGITQTQVNRDKGLDFPTTLRAFMRQDPDVLLVGETRDLETAKTAIEAALTGHLVLTTLHCNDAASAITRLDEMGVEPFMVSASLLGIVSQRLVRRVCSECRISYHPSPEELSRFGLLGSEVSDVTFYRANTAQGRQKGACTKCNGNGYKGRVGAFEVLRVNDAISTAIAQRQTTDVVRRLALESGMKTLLGYGLELVREGHTTLAEVQRILLTDAGLESERRSRALSTLTCNGCGAGLSDDWLECPYCLTPR